MKGHIGHAEAAAAGFGEISLIDVALHLTILSLNVNLKRLNPHLSSHATNRFTTPTEVTNILTQRLSLITGHINSFGLTGIIAHGHLI